MRFFDLKTLQEIGQLRFARSQYHGLGALPQHGPADALARRPHRGYFGPQAPFV